MKRILLQSLPKVREHLQSPHLPDAPKSMLNPQTTSMPSTLDLSELHALTITMLETINSLMKPRPTPVSQPVESPNPARLNEVIQQQNDSFEGGLASTTAAARHPILRPIPKLQTSPIQSEALPLFCVPRTPHKMECHQTVPRNPQSCTKEVPRRTIYHLWRRELQTNSAPF